MQNEGICLEHFLAQLEQIRERRHVEASWSRVREATLLPWACRLIAASCRC